jgi:hypothetical protein
LGSTQLDISRTGLSLPELRFQASERVSIRTCTNTDFGAGR